MQKQTIYSYLQRSLVKILSRSAHSNKYKTTLVKRLKTCSTSIADNAQPIKNSIKLVPLPTQIPLQNKNLNFFRKVNSSFMPFLRALGQVEHQPSLNFTCKFYLISFRIRPWFGVLILKCYGSILVNFAKQKKSQAAKQKLIKLNQNLNNDQLLYYFIAKLLDIRFYSGTLCYKSKIFACPPCLTCFCYSTCPVLWARRACPPLVKPYLCCALRANRCGEGIEKLTPRLCRAREAATAKALLLANPFDQILCKASTNFSFYNQQSPLFFYQSFYKRKDKSKNYRKTFHNLFYFFSFFSFSTNKEVSFLNFAELAAVKQVSFTRYAQQVLYLEKIYGLTYCFQLSYFSSINLDPLKTLDFLLNKTSIIRGCSKDSFIPKKRQMQCFSSQLLYFLTIIFYVAIKYVKQSKKETDDSFQFVLRKNNSIYHFNKIIDLNFISFKPSLSKLVISDSAFNSHYFFLMRPLFSVTRLDTFFICESLKLPIYPDKSNLRVDFLRNRIRKQILPAIRILLNPQFDTILCKFHE